MPIVMPRPGDSHSLNDTCDTPPLGLDWARKSPRLAASSAAVAHSEGRISRFDHRVAKASENRRAVAPIGSTTTTRPMPSAAAWHT